MTLMISKGAGFALEGKLTAEYQYEEGEAYWLLFADRHREQLIAMLKADGTCVMADGRVYGASTKEFGRMTNQPRSYKSHKKREIVPKISQPSLPAVRPILWYCITKDAEVLDKCDGCVFATCLKIDIGDHIDPIRETTDKDV